MFELLTDLIATGRAGPSQTADILQLLDAMPAMTMTSNLDGSVSATHEVMSAEILPHLSNATFTLDPSTGHPIRMQSNSDPSYRIDYLSVTPVRLADYVKATDAGTTEQSPPSTVEGP